MNKDQIKVKVPLNFNTLKGIVFVITLIAGVAYHMSYLGSRVDSIIKSTNLNTKASQKLQSKVLVLTTNSNQVKKDNKLLNDVVESHFTRIAKGVGDIQKWIRGAEMRFIKIENQISRLKDDCKRLSTKVIK